MLLGGSHLFSTFAGRFLQFVCEPFFASCWEYGMEQGERDVGDKVLERRFKVGELVAFVEGSNVRGYRTDSGEAAWVKEDYGLCTGGTCRVWRACFREEGSREWYICDKNGGIV